MKNFTSLILLAGGRGTRLGGGTPKQFRKLKEKPLALYSFELFDALDEIAEIIVVSEENYYPLFHSLKKPVRFALPGKRRQDSVYNGLLATSQNADFVCVHDSARPFVQKSDMEALLQKAYEMGAAALAIPATNTIKRVDSSQSILATLKREELWELQTPQAIRRSLFLRAYEHAQKWDIEATDDLSLVEALQEPCAVVKSSPRNLKITTPFDWSVAEIYAL